MTNNPYFIFNAIADETTKKGKEQIILENSHNEDFLEILDFVYNPMILTGISKKKLNKKVNQNILVDSDVVEGSIFDVMDYLKNNNTGADKDILVVQEFLKTVESKALYDFLAGVITKDLKIGITSKTINKALGYDFIKTFTTMKYTKYEGEPINDEIAISIKLDGTHGVAINLSTGVEIYTQEGRRIEGLTELEEQFKHMPVDYVYSGELLALNHDDLPSGELFRVTQKILKTDGLKKDIAFYVFDCVTVEEFEKGYSGVRFKERLALIDYHLLLDKNEEVTLIKQVPYLFIGQESEVDIEKLLDLVLSNNYEGLMINKMSGIYEHKKSKDVLKVKKFYYFDLEVVDIEEHKHGNKIGAFVVDYKGYRVNVGSGISEEDRIKWWEQKDELIGRVIEVKNFGESKNQQGGLSLRFPTFKRIREVGKEVSYD